ncbi:MAG TPA: serine/threonine-protein kinase [Bacilli bacterium]
MEQDSGLLQAGELIGNRYRIMKPLGKGGMGAVYLAADIRLNGKKRAVKATDWTAEGKSAFQVEAEMLMRLNHPHLPDIVDYFPPDESGKAYLIMEYVAGDTLEQLLFKRKWQLPLSELLEYARQLCELLEYLHHGTEQRIIFRDLKPSNVIIDQRGNVRLIDFGIARKFKQDHLADTLQIGTIGFAAPELFEHVQSDERADLYSLGALLYYALTEGQYYSVARKPIAEERNDLQEDVTALVDRLLRDDPAERLQSAEEVKALLANLLERERAGLSVAACKLPGGAETKKKLVLLASLYPGAGSTFLTVALARALHRCKVAHAVIESPLNEPELYYILAGEANAPQGYRFLADDVFTGQQGAYAHWRNGGTDWYPANPAGFAEEWTDKHMLMLLYGIAAPILLVDVSHHWRKPAVKELFAFAEAVVFAAEPVPGKMNRNDTREHLALINREKWNGQNIFIAANRDVDFRFRREWIASLPFPPLCSIPEIPLRELFAPMRKGMLPHDQPHIAEKLDHGIAPLVDLLAPGAFAGKSRRKKGWLAFKQRR